MSKASSDAIAARLQGAGAVGVSNVLTSLLPVTFDPHGAIAGMPHETVLRFWRDAFEHRMPVVTQFHGALTDQLHSLRLKWNEDRTPPTSFVGDVRQWYNRMEYQEQVAWIEKEGPYLDDKGGDGVALGIAYARNGAPGFDGNVNFGDVDLQSAISLAHAASNATFEDLVHVQVSTPLTFGAVTFDTRAAFASLGTFPPTADPHNRTIQHGISVKQAGARDVIVNGYGIYDDTAASFTDQPATFSQDDIKLPWQPIWMGNHQGGWSPSTPTRYFLAFAVLCREFGPFTIGRRYLSVAEWQIIHRPATGYAYVAPRQDSERIARLVQDWSIGQTSAFLQDVEAGMDPNLMDDDTLKRRYAVPSSVTPYAAHLYHMEEATDTDRVDSVGSKDLIYNAGSGSIYQWDAWRGKGAWSAPASSGVNARLEATSAWLPPGYDKPFAVNFFFVMNNTSPDATIGKLIANGNNVGTPGAIPADGGFWVTLPNDDNPANPTVTGPSFEITDGATPVLVDLSAQLITRNAYFMVGIAWDGKGSGYFGLYSNSRWPEKNSAGQRYVDVEAVGTFAFAGPLPAGMADIASVLGAAGESPINGWIDEVHVMKNTYLTWAEQKARFADIPS